MHTSVVVGHRSGVAEKVIGRAILISSITENKIQHLRTFNQQSQHEIFNLNTVSTGCPRIICAIVTYLILFITQQCFV